MSAKVTEKEKKEKDREYDRKWRKNNKEKTKEYAKKYWMKKLKTIFIPWVKLQIKPFTSKIFREQCKITESLSYIIIKIAKERNIIKQVTKKGGIKGQWGGSGFVLYTYNQKWEEEGVEEIKEKIIKEELRDIKEIISSIEVIKDNEKIMDSFLSYRQISYCPILLNF